MDVTIAGRVVRLEEPSTRQVQRFRQAFYAAALGGRMLNVDAELHAGALLGLWLPRSRLSIRLRDHGHDYLDYGEAVLDALEKAGATEEEIDTAASAAWKATMPEPGKAADAGPVSDEEVEEELGNSEAQAETSTSSE